MTTLIKALQKLSLTEIYTVPKALPSIRHIKRWVDKPEIGRGKSFRRIVHYPENYTVQPLQVTNLGGRDPLTGRMVVKGIGGGIKHKYHWIDWKRHGPTEGPPIVEKVIKIINDGCRTAHVALVAHDDKLRYILATQNMKEGDLIKTSGHIPRIPGNYKKIILCIIKKDNNRIFFNIFSSGQRRGCLPSWSPTDGHPSALRGKISWFRWVLSACCRYVSFNLSEGTK